jgi:predicted transposase/invertase (TIGR01784 family)
MMQKPFIDLTSDFGFKKLFGEEPNKDLLISFLNEVFQGRKQILDLEYTRNEAQGESFEDGTAIFDLVCTGKEGEKFIIEVQRALQENFKKRAIYYTSRLISNQAPKGKKAKWMYNISEVYLIALMQGFTVSDPRDTHYLHHVYLCNLHNNSIFYPGLGYIYIELPKFNKLEHQLENDLDRWIFLLKNMATLEKISVYLHKPIFEKVFDIATYSKLKKEDRMTYDVAQKNRWDLYSIKETAFNAGKKEGIQSGIEKGIQTGIEKGREEGREEGIQEGIRNVIEKMLQQGLALEQISDWTGLSIEQIKQFKKA